MARSRTRITNKLVDFAVKSSARHSALSPRCDHRCDSLCTPIDTSTLLNSQFKRIFVRDGKVVGVVGYTADYEHASAKFGDLLALGDQSSSALPVPSARPVRVIERYADTFDRRADDFCLIT